MLVMFHVFTKWRRIHEFISQYFISERVNLFIMCLSKVIILRIDWYFNSLIVNGMLGIDN